MTTLQIISFVFLWAAVIAEGGLLILLYRHVGFLFTRATGGLEVGTTAPLLLAKNSHDNTLALRDLLQANYTVLVFGSPRCLECRALLRDQNVTRFLAARALSGYFMIEASDAAAAASLAANASLDVLIAGKGTFKDYNVRSTPFAYVLTQTGEVAARGAVADGLRSIVRLSDQAAQGFTRAESVPSARVALK